MQPTISENKNQFVFVFLVFALSIPFWILGATVELKDIIPINLPISALMLLCPLTAAIILKQRETDHAAVKTLLKRVADFRQIKNRLWYIPMLLLIPATMLFSYLIMKYVEMPLPEPDIQWRAAPVLFILFFIGAIAEEIGWTGYLTDPLQKRFGALNTGFIIGSIWAIWHVVPYIQAHRSPNWILWQCIGTLALRIIFIWIYNNTGKSVFAVILCHTTVNLSEYLFPNYGSHYNPFIFALLLIFITAVITCFWSAKTLNEFRYQKPIKK